VPAKRSRFTPLTILLLCASWWAEGATEAERIRNDRVVVIEYSLGSGELLVVDAMRPAVTVYLDEGKLILASETSGSETRQVHRGEAAFSPPGAETIRNSNSSAMRFVRIEFAGAGSGAVLGKSNLPSESRVLLENIYARVSDVRVPAGHAAWESGRDRVEICLSGCADSAAIVWRPAGEGKGDAPRENERRAIEVEPK
jgi:hypothetical protein